MAARLGNLYGGAAVVGEDQVEEREGLQDLPGVTLTLPQTNILFVDLAPERAAGIVERLRARGVLCTGLYRLRFVTHLDVSADDIDHALRVLRATL